MFKERGKLGWGTNYTISRNAKIFRFSYSERTIFCEGKWKTFLEYSEIFYA
jgi:hypothetical protein